MREPVEVGGSERRHGASSGPDGRRLRSIGRLGKKSNPQRPTGDTRAHDRPRPPRSSTRMRATTAAPGGRVE
ncbi:Hypothetical protein A7982_00308 [Minicystis rosea]|nr:Hypothetical protein A7982_00308 [Minicystis rosea]